MSTSVFEAARKLLEAEFNTGWGVRTPIKWENVAFEMPSNSAWVSFVIRWGVSDQISVGPAGVRLERHNAVVIIQIFTPKTTGGKASAEHCDFAAAIFRMKQLADNTTGINVLFRTPEVVDAGTEAELMQRNVVVPFQLDSFW